MSLEDRLNEQDVINEQALGGEELAAAIQKFREGEPVKVEPFKPSPELTKAIEKFKEQFAERTYSQRHEELGKMINCHLCNRRHREADPLALSSHAHRSDATFRDLPSRHVLFAKRRFNPHRNAKILQFVRLTEKILKEEIEPFFRPDPEHPDNLIRRAQRRAAKVMRRTWIKERLVQKHMQDHSRRINAGLEVPGSRYSHPVKDHKAA